MIKLKNKSLKPDHIFYELDIIKMNLVKIEIQQKFKR